MNVSSWAGGPETPPPRHTYIHITCLHRPPHPHPPTHTHTLIDTDVHTHLHGHIHIPIHRYSCTFTDTHRHTRPHTCAHAHTYILAQAERPGWGTWGGSRVLAGETPRENLLSREELLTGPVAGPKLECNRLGQPGAPSVSGLVVAAGGGGGRQGERREHGGGKL